MTLRQACEKLLTYRHQAGPIGYQLEKADDYHRMIRKALDTPDLSDELATALRTLHPRKDVWRTPDSDAAARIEAVLARYDAAQSVPPAR